MFLFFLLISIFNSLHLPLLLSFLLFICSLHPLLLFVSQSFVVCLFLCLFTFFSNSRPHFSPFLSSHSVLFPFSKISLSPFPFIPHLFPSRFLYFSGTRRVSNATTRHFNPDFFRSSVTPPVPVRQPINRGYRATGTD